MLAELRKQMVARSGGNSSLSRIAKTQFCSPRGSIPNSNALTSDSKKMIDESSNAIRKYKAIKNKEVSRQ